MSPTNSITVFSKIIAIFCFSTSSPHNSLVKIVPKLWLQAIAPEIIPSLSVQKLKYKCKVPLIQNFTLLFYLFFLLCTNLYHNNLILLILLFLFSILFLVIYLTLSFLHFLVIYNIHLLSWLLLRYS